MRASKRCLRQTTKCNPPACTGFCAQARKEGKPLDHLSNPKGVGGLATAAGYLPTPNRHQLGPKPGGRPQVDGHRANYMGRFRTPSIIANPRLAVAPVVNSVNGVDVQPNHVRFSQAVMAMVFFACHYIRKVTILKMTVILRVRVAARITTPKVPRL